MKTWTQFLEGKKEDKALEKKEEDLGMDLDNDNEKGESKTHKEKVLGKKKEVLK